MGEARLDNKVGQVEQVAACRPLPPPHTRSSSECPARSGPSSGPDTQEVVTFISLGWTRAQPEQDYRMGCVWAECQGLCRLCGLRSTPCPL